MRPFQQAAIIQQYYGELGKTVYDRRDRWTAEHVSCKDTHQSTTEMGVYVVSCELTGAVLVSTGEETFGHHVCIECLRTVVGEDVPEFVRNDHVCRACAG